MVWANCLAMFWRHCGGTSYTKQFHSVTFPATAKIVARQVGRTATALATSLATILAFARYVTL